MQVPPDVPEREYQPSARVRAFRLAFGLLLLTALIALGVRP